MGRITGIQWYYHAQCLLFLSLGIFCFVFVSSFGSDSCYAISTSTDSSTNSTTTNTTSTNTTVLESCPVMNVTTNTSYTVIAGILGFVYIAEVGLMVIMALFLYYFSNLDISEFADLGWCQNCFGKLTKCIPYLIVLDHLIGFVLIVAELFMVYVAKGCKNACHLDPTTATVAYGTMQSQGESLVVVCAIAWVLMHVIGGFCRRNVYYDSFFYQPEEKSVKWVLWCCIRCGP